MRAAWRRRAKRGAWAAAVLAGVWLFGLRLLLWLPPLQAIAKEKVEDALRARVGVARLEGPVRGGIGSRLSLGPLRLGLEGDVTIAEVTVWPALGALLQGRIHPAAVHLRDARVRLDGPTLKHLRARQTKPANEPADTATARPSLSFEDLQLEQGRTTWLAPTLGPFDGRLSAGRARLTLPDGGTLELLLEGQTVRGHLDAVALRSERWAGPRVAKGLVASGELSGSFTLTRAGADATAQLDLSLRQGALTEPRIARAPLEGLAAGIALELGLSGSALTLRKGSFTLGEAREVRAELAGAVTLQVDMPASLSLHAPGLRYDALVAALPGELRPPPEAPHYAGEVAARARFEGPLKDPDRWTLEVKLELDAARKQSRGLKTLAGEVRYAAVSADGRSFPVTVGPKNPRYVPLEELPRHVPLAVLTSEDASFYSHPGFAFAELRASIVDALLERRVRGASTLTQQLAKNLFVSKDHTLARKVREAVVTLALEASVPKERLLEVYLNAVEWGPGIFGVGTAAQHYFAKDARQLTAKEAAFLATLLPSPLRYHSYHLRGLTEVWEQRLSELLAKMAEEGALTSEEYDAAREEPLHFSPTCGT